MFWASNLTSVKNFQFHVKNLEEGSEPAFPLFFYEYPASRIPPFCIRFPESFLCVYCLVWNSHLLLEYVTWHVWVVTISRIYDRHVNKPAWSAHILPTNILACFCLTVKSRFLLSYLVFCVFPNPAPCFGQIPDPKILFQSLPIPMKQ